MEPLLLAILVAPLTPSPFLPQQSQDDTAELIEQLGNESAETRDGASKKLRSVGVPALVALKDASKSKDPEVQARAKALVKEITWDNRALYLAEQWGTGVKDFKRHRPIDPPGTEHPRQARQESPRWGRSVALSLGSHLQRRVY